MRKNRIGYFCIVVMVVVLLLFYHNYFFFLLFIAVIGLPIFSFSVARVVFRKLSLEVGIPVTFVEEKNSIPIQFVVKNGTFFPMPGLHFWFRVENEFYSNQERQDVALPIYAGEQRYDWSVTSVYAGRICLRGEKIRMQDYLGLFVFQRELALERTVCVIPEKSQVIMNWVEASVRDGEEQEMDTENSVEDVTQVKEIREYKPGDRLQRIHWKLSTKQEELYVKEYEREYNRTLTLLVELRQDSDEVGFLNSIITAFYSTACRLLEEEMKFQVQWFDVRQNCFQTERVEEEEDLLDVLQQIYMMQTYKDWEAYVKYKEGEHGRADMAIYFTSVTFPDYNPEMRIGTFEDRVMLVCL
ncbi:MAG: DUF58 domain-containing protein [Lachnospiraceae bacterium]|nr:DUF58 domain-containing protein [Lachnospiraceae bacterium]